MKKIFSVLIFMICVSFIGLLSVSAYAGVGDAEFCPPPDNIPFVRDGVTYDYLVQVKAPDLKQYFFYGVSSRPLPVIWSFEHDPYHGLSVEGTEISRVATLSASPDCSGMISDVYIPANGIYYNLFIFDGEPYFFSGAPDNINYIIRSTVALTGTANIAATAFGGGPLFTLKLPLPGGKSWLLTTKTGGATCIGGGGTDVYHTNENNGYFSLDFDDISQQSGQQTSVPVYAAAAGEVNVSLTGWSSSYGWTVVIDHVGGYRTRYAHLADQPLVGSGVVLQGTQLGVLGGTGSGSAGTHLHFQVYYNGSSLSTDSALSSVRMEGVGLEAYDISTGGCSAYYSSTNTQ